MKIIGEKIIGAGINDDGVAYITLSNGQNLYLDEIEKITVEDELDE